MKLSQRTGLVVLLVGLCLLLGILFRSFLLDNFVRPVALVFWLFWQVVLSVDQRIYWGLLIVSALVYAFFQLAKELTEIKLLPPPASNSTMDNINYWRVLLRLSGDKVEKADPMKGSLREMLAAMYTSRRPETPHWKVDEELQKRQIPLPDHIYRFLYPVEPPGGKPTLSQALQSIRDVPEKWARRWTGRDVTEYYQSIEAVLTFIEFSMEKKHDDKHFDAH